ncbi:hypothetical protein [Methylocystis iwaonis]|uniref:Uncharacterized protein n=1 Tax=Methylocystis iwaonis TaxID=2885079 RepID=A0ABM8EEE7_9HYPH|nr:hypothetical protein [Methylocystis iwaonis]BDV36303.1 hypothetical protein SS37A_38330 [Methylocystis iwaonis]
MWDAILGIKTELGLIAFAIAVALLWYRARLSERLKVIQSVPEAQRLDAVEALAEYLHIDVSGLPDDLKYKIVLEQLKIKSNREMMIGGIFLTIALGLIGASLFSPVGRASASVEYVVCQGETRRDGNCPNGSTFLSCGEDVDAWASERCAEFKKTRTYQTHGGMCGYETYKVTCTKVI